MDMKLPGSGSNLQVGMPPDAVARREKQANEQRFAPAKSDEEAELRYRKEQEQKKKRKKRSAIMVLTVLIAALFIAESHCAARFFRARMREQAAADVFAVENFSVEESGDDYVFRFRVRNRSGHEELFHLYLYALTEGGDRTEIAECQRVTDLVDARFGNPEKSLILPAKAEAEAVFTTPKSGIDGAKCDLILSTGENEAVVYQFE